MLLNVGVRSNDDALDLDVQTEFGCIRLDERDRALGIASALSLQHRYQMWGGARHNMVGRTCRATWSAARDNERRASQECD